MHSFYSKNNLGFSKGGRCNGAGRNDMPLTRGERILVAVDGSDRTFKDDGAALFLV
jgi:hypothetical protein